MSRPTSRPGTPMIARGWLSTGSSNMPTGPAHNVAPDVSRISRSGAVDERDAVDLRVPDPEAVAPQDVANRVGRNPRRRRAVGQSRVEEGLRLDDTDIRRLAPQARRPVDRADDDGGDEDDESQAEPGRREDMEDLQLLHAVDDGRPERRVVAVTQLRHLRRIDARLLEGATGELADRHPDDRHHREDADLEDRKVD